MISQKEIIEKFLRTKELITESFDMEGKLKHRFSGKVKTEKISNNEIIFREDVQWKNENSLLINSKNIYRWIFLDSGNIKLEHLRFGINNPVSLVELYQDGENTLKSIEPHNCNNDLYSAILNLENSNIVLSWTVKGPSDNYSLKTVYSI